VPLALPSAIRAYFPFTRIPHRTRWAMASDLGYVEHVCDQLREIGGVSYRKMFGEYALYVGGKVVALVCDNQLFVKPTEAGRRLLGEPVEGAPYPGAKPHFVVDEHIDDRELLTAVFRATESELPEPKPKKRRG
jgi:TfoX/Sxy family transcriptional regulator of competence genes